jgi:hypothetical protein
MQNNGRRKFNFCRLAMIGFVGMMGAVATAGLVVATYDDQQAGGSAPVLSRESTAGDVKQPTAADIDQCNSYATKAREKTGDVPKGIAAGGCRTADGGEGTGIGSLPGATVGTVYGLSHANQCSTQAEAAYRACMVRRGYNG